MGLQTDAIHAAEERDPRTNSVAAPLYQTTTYAHDTVGSHKGWSYARADNPTREALEARLAALEGAKYGVGFASGLAAIAGVGSLLGPGDHMLVSSIGYGGTHRYFSSVLARYGVNISFVDTSDLKAVDAALQPSTRIVFVETPSNPLLTLTDLAEVAEMGMDMADALGEMGLPEDEMTEAFADIEGEQKEALEEDLKEMMGEVERKIVVERMM